MLARKLIAPTTGGGGGSGFPIDTFGGDLLAWYDASDSGSLSLSGSDVTQWNDLSGNAEHISVAVAGRYPQYSATSFNSSYPGLTFSDDYLSCTHFASQSDATMTVVAIATMNSGTASYGRLVSLSASGQANDSGNSGSSCMLLRNASEATISSYRNSGLRAFKTATSYATPYVFISEYDGTNNNIYVNNTAGTSAAFTANFGGSSSRLTIGTGWEASAYSSSYWNGVVAEIYIINRALTSGERSSIQTDAARWGL